MQAEFKAMLHGFAFRRPLQGFGSTRARLFYLVFGFMLGLSGCAESVDESSTKFAAEAFLESRNAYLAISKSALEEMIQVPVNVSRDIQDTVAGVSITAKTLTTGQVGLKLIPSADDARFDTIVEAVTNIDIAGKHNPRSDIQVDLTGRATVSSFSSKPVTLNVNAVKGREVSTKSESSLAVTGVHVTATGWFPGYKRKKAEEAVWETIRKERPGQERAIGERVVREVEASIEERAGNFLLKFNNTFVRHMREWFVDSGFLPGRQLFQTSSETLWFSSIGPSTGGGFLSAETVMPPDTVSAIADGQQSPIIVGFSADALEHGFGAMLSGKSYPLAALGQMLVTIGALEVPTVWDTFNFGAVKATFADHQPLAFRLNRGTIAVTARFKSFSIGGMMYPGAAMTLTYSAALLDDQNIGFKQISALEPFDLDDPESGLPETHVLAKFYREIIEPRTKKEFSLPVPNLSGISLSLANLRLQLVQVEQGWVRVGTTLGTLKK